MSGALAWPPPVPVPRAVLACLPLLRAPASPRGHLARAPGAALISTAASGRWWVVWGEEAGLPSSLFSGFSGVTAGFLTYTWALSPLGGPF